MGSYPQKSLEAHDAPIACLPFEVGLDIIVVRLEGRTGSVYSAEDSDVPRQLGTACSRAGYLADKILTKGRSIENDEPTKKERLGFGAGNVSDRNARPATIEGVQRQHDGKRKEKLQVVFHREWWVPSRPMTAL